MQYKCVVDGILLAEKESKAPITLAVVASNSSTGEAVVAFWAKNQEAATKFVVSSKGKKLISVGAKLTITAVEKVQTELPIEPPAPAAAEPPADEEPVADEPVEELPVVDQPAGPQRFERTYHGSTYQVVFDPETNRTTIDNVVYKSPTAAANALTGGHVNGKKFFGIVSPRQATTSGKRGKRDLVRAAQKKLARAEATVEERRLRLAKIESKLQAAMVELAAARDEATALNTDADRATA